MDFQIIDRHSLDEESWKNLARHGSFFQTIGWVDVCVTGLGSAAEALFFCAYDNDRLVAGMPAVVNKMYGLKTIDSMPNGTYGGPLFSYELDNAGRMEFNSFLDQYFDGKNFSRVAVIDFADSLSEWKAAGFDRNTHFTHIVELDSDGAYKPPGKKTTAEIRAGEKLGGVIGRINDRGDVARFYDIYLATVKRHGIKKPLYDLKFFEAILNIPGRTDTLYWTALTVDGEMIGSQINFLYGDTLFYWQAVSLYEKRIFRPNYRLLFDAFSRAVERGLKRVNLGASPPDAEGLIFFKERWGARQVEYQSITYRSTLRKIIGR